MNDQTETVGFIKNTTIQPPPSTSKGCCSKWWNQNFAHQRAICRVIESTRFLVFVIVLVVIDTILIVAEIMLDFLKLQHECQKEFGHKAHHHNHKAHERIEFTMEVLHYTSIAILTFFVLELLIKIYAFGREFWNIHRKKMEYLDAVIVIASLSLDLYFLRGEETILGNRSLLVISIRLWRFARIINSVEECVRKDQLKHKRRLNKQYLIAVQRLIGLLMQKTDHIQQQPSDNNEKFDSILKYFRQIDTQCQSSLEALNENDKLTSSLLVKKFNEELSKLDLKDGDNPTQKFDNLSEV